MSSSDLRQEARPGDGAQPVLRRMRWWDISAIADIERRLFRHDPWSVETFWSELAGVPDQRWYLVAESAAGELVGYAGLLTVRDEGGIQTVAVREDHQGTGLGRRLLHALLDEAGRRGCRTVILEVRADNKPAQALYETAGFEVIGRRRDYYGPRVDALVMRRRGRA